MKNKKTEKLLKESSGEYQKISHTIKSLLKGDIQGEEANKIIDKSLDKVDNLIIEFEK